MKAIEEVANQLVQLQRYRYYVERYLAGLKRLTVVARPMQDLGLEDAQFITFGTVDYIQMPTYWEKAPFILGTSDESRVFLEDVGIPIVGDLPRLFYAQLPKSRIYVVCWSVDLSDAMPP
jgi:hypothetical protein